MMKRSTLASVFRRLWKSVPTPHPFFRSLNRRIRLPRRWTFLVWSDHGGHTKQYSLTENLLKKGMIGVLLCVLGLSTALAGFFSDASQRAQHARLKRENRLLGEQMAVQRKVLDQLENTLDELEKQDHAFRLLAGLEPLSQGMYGAGGAPAALPAHDGVARLSPELSRAVVTGSFDLDAITRRVRTLRSSWDQAVNTLQTKQDRLAATPSILPTVGFMSSAFTRHRWHPILDEKRAHAGIDIAAPIGTPIHAAARGRVAFVGYHGPYGLLIELDHGHGYVTRYAHLARANVRKGEIVTRRAMIGEVGESGLAIGPHLHYEVLVNGVPQNPMGYIFDKGAIPD